MFVGGISAILVTLNNTGIPPRGTSSYITTESGDRLTTEDGKYIVTQPIPPSADSFINTEASQRLLTEDNRNLITEQ